MGFFDLRCMLTGVSVDYVGAVVVVLRCTPSGYEPISVGIPGDYDGTGSIFPDEDRAADLLHGYLVQLHRNGRFVVESAVAGEAVDFTDQYGLQGLLSYIMDSWLLAWPSDDESFAPLPLTVLDGATLVNALIAQPVWDAIVSATSGSAMLGSAMLGNPFGDCAILREIYGSHVAEIGPQLNALARVDEFVRSHELRWAPPADPDQRYPSDGCQWGEDECAEYVAQARLDYRDSPAVLAGLDAYVERLKEEGPC